MARTWRACQFVEVSAGSLLGRQVESHQLRDHLAAGDVGHAKIPAREEIAQATGAERGVGGLHAGKLFAVFCSLPWSFHDDFDHGGFVI